MNIQMEWSEKYNPEDWDSWGRPEDSWVVDIVKKHLPKASGILHGNGEDHLLFEQLEPQNYTFLGYHLTDDGLLTACKAKASINVLDQNLIVPKEINLIAFFDIPPTRLYYIVE